jgi:hypothetical protein
MERRKRFEIRVSNEQFAVLKQAAHTRGYRSVGAFVQAAALNDLRDSTPERTDTETILAASIGRLAKDIRTVHTTQQALFAVVDSLTRLFLTCIPEPPPEALEPAKRRARLRYNRFLVTVAQNMASDSRATLTELTDRA